LGIKDIRIGKGEVVEESTSRCFRVCCYEDIFKGSNVKLVDLKRGQFLPMGVWRGQGINPSFDNLT